MGVVSPEGVTRPFDRTRSGFMFGEGAGVIVLESAAHAEARGARTLVRLSGWALGADAHSAVAFNSNGAKIAGVVARALGRAGLSASDVRHVNAHGTGTRLNDWIETQALMTAFGTHAKKLMISATKASTGHLLGAAGSVEFILTVLSPYASIHSSDGNAPNAGSGMRLGLHTPARPCGFVRTCALLVIRIWRPDRRFGQCKKPSKRASMTLRTEWRF